MKYDEIKIFFIVLLAILNFITIFGSAINLILNWKKQSKSSINEERLNEHDKRLDDYGKRLSDLEKGKSENDGFTKVLCRSILAILSHEINGNSKDKLEKSKEELEKFLVEK
ncbi:MAG: hypothetical protein IJ193_03560 [Bacilli bacterium]|nr:hypothetical protein [Bacilli bacterium]